MTRKSRPNTLSLTYRTSFPIMSRSQTGQQGGPRCLLVAQRTSTVDQKAGLDAQGRELKAAGCEKLFAEQVSSAAQRPKLAECLAFLREGDTLICTRPRPPWRARRLSC